MESSAEQDKAKDRGKAVWIPTTLYGELRAKAYGHVPPTTITELVIRLIESGLKNRP